MLIAGGRETLIEHYRVAAPIMERLIGRVPLVWVTWPHGFSKPRWFHGPLSPRTTLAGPYVDVQTKSGPHRYAALTADLIEALSRTRASDGAIELQAVEFHSWTPMPTDPDRAAFGRLLIEVEDSLPSTLLKEAMLAVRAMLFEEGLECVPLFDGGSGAALWIPLADGPAYPQLRAWLDELCARAAARHPNLLTTQPNTHPGTCAHLHASSNAPGHYSILPYSARGTGGYPLAIPIAWTAIANYDNGTVHAGDLPAWLNEHGERLSEELQTIPPQAFGDRGAARKKTMAPAVPRAPGPQGTRGTWKSRGHVITAAIDVLSDGVTRDADRILSDAIARGLLPKDFARKLVYTALIEYIVRANGAGRRPAIVQVEGRAFRLNEPEDAWPAVALPAPVPIPATRQAAIDGLDAAMNGGDPTAFEVAACNAFEALGFTATHIGGEQDPDGYADAALGVLGYRTMLECKTGKFAVTHPDAFEAQKYRTPYGAQFCALIGSAFGDEIELAKELQTHGVSAWTVEDLQTLLRMGANPYEMRVLFAPGFAADRLEDVAWERAHGAAKRVRYVVETLQASVWAMQVAQAPRNVPGDQPVVTEDAAMLMVDQALRAAGSTAVCDRQTVRDAFAYMTNPMVGVAVMTADGGGLVVTDGSDR